MTRPEKITLAETRTSGVRGVLVYCAVPGLTFPPKRKAARRRLSQRMQLLFF
jgi:hypothetical protein